MLDFSRSNTLKKTSRFSILNRGPLLWNNVLNKETKSILSLSDFRNTIKKQLINLEKEQIHF